jgi:hypothetical protein
MAQVSHYIIEVYRHLQLVFSSFQWFKILFDNHAITIQLFFFLFFCASLGGSFRHFLWQTARELESSFLGLFIPCPSAGSHHNRGKFIMKPGPMTYSEERLLLFLGQVSC